MNKWLSRWMHFMERRVYFTLVMGLAASCGIAVGIHTRSLVDAMYATATAFMIVSVWHLILAGYNLSRVAGVRRRSWP